MGIGDYLGFLFGSGAEPPQRPLPSGPVEVVLEELGPRKIAVIKEVRELSHLGLAETKRLVESAPTVVARVATPEAAEMVVHRLRQAGAVASVRGDGPAEPQSTTSSGGTFLVRLNDSGPHLIQVIKAIRESVACDLRTAKEFADRAPVTMGPYDQERALALLVALTEAGATAELE